jgi:hypothetical protein
MSQSLLIHLYVPNGMGMRFSLMTQVEVYSRAGTDEKLHLSKASRNKNEEEKHDVDNVVGSPPKRNSTRLQSRELGARGPESDSSSSSSSSSAEAAGASIAASFSPHIGSEKASPSMGLSASGSAERPPPSLGQMTSADLGWGQGPKEGGPSSVSTNGGDALSYFS